MTRLRAQGISKTFAGRRVLDGASLELAAHEVRGLVGANGSGKSTLVKILAGVYAPDAGSGTIAVDGVRLALPIDPRAARTAGVRFVHQDLGLVERRPVFENLALDRPFLRTRLGLVDWRREREEARATLRAFGASFGADELAGELSPGEQALVAIVRALAHSAHEMSVLILDEPTVGLPPSEVDLVLDAVERVSSRGVSVVLVSHSIDAVQRVCDTVTVLRDGRVVLDGRSAQSTRADLVDALSGHRPEVVAEPARTGPVSAGSRPLLEVRSLRSTAIGCIDIVLRSGEICGIAGDLDSGAGDVLPAIYGALPADVDSVVVDGVRIGKLSPRACRSAGVAYLPADRARDSVLSEMTLRENLIAGDVSELCSHAVLRPAREREIAGDLVRRFAIVPPELERPIEALSGGNQQKALLARWLRLRPRVLLLQEPTQGVDVSARDDIAGQIRAVAQRRGAVLIHASDVASLATLCQRVIVMRRGSVVDTVAGAAMTPHRLRHALHDVGTRA